MPRRIPRPLLLALALWTYDVMEQETLDLPELGPVQAPHPNPMWD